MFGGDEQEGLPPLDYIRQACANIGPGHDFDYSLQTLKEDRKAFFISCWHLFELETAEMWEIHGPAGVAIVSRYSALQSILDTLPDRTFLGRVRYGLKPHRYNTLHFITTKRPDFVNEQEVRALIWRPELSDRNPYPHDTPNGLEHPFEVQRLIEGVVVSPRAPAGRLREIESLLGSLGHSIPVRESGLTSYAALLPELKDIKRLSSK